MQYRQNEVFFTCSDIRIIILFVKLCLTIPCLLLEYYNKNLDVSSKRIQSPSIGSIPHELVPVDDTRFGIKELEMTITSEELLPSIMDLEKEYF